MKVHRYTRLEKILVRYNFLRYFSQITTPRPKKGTGVAGSSKFDPTMAFSTERHEFLAFTHYVYPGIYQNQASI